MYRVQGKGNILNFDVGIEFLLELTFKVSIMTSYTKHMLSSQGLANIKGTGTFIFLMYI